MRLLTVRGWIGLICAGALPVLIALVLHGA
jgi:hypothetical protein